MKKKYEQKNLRKQITCSIQQWKIDALGGREKCKRLAEDYLNSLTDDTTGQ